jgi:anti-sigma factor RsiW
MKTPSDENHDLIRWLDGEMTAAERRAFEATLQNDPELAAEVESMRQLSESLKAHLPAEMPVPHADFFNSQIQVRIAQMEADDAREREKAAASTAGWLSWLRMPWLAGAAAAAFAIAGLVWTQNGSSGRSTILSTYTPNPSVKAQIIENAEAGATVIMLEGLAPIPADKKVAGFKVHHAESDAEVATTTLFDENGTVLAVVALNAKGQPQMLK